LRLPGYDNLAEISESFRGFPDSQAMLDELIRYYLPTYNAQGRPTYGFSAWLRASWPAW